jgi:hypothetical protein
LIAQQVQVQELQPGQVLESVPAQESQLVQAQELVLVLVLQLVQAQESVQAQVLESQLELVQVQHPLHQPPQSPFQRQPSHLQQRESLSTLQQLAKVLPYQLCL